MDVTDAGSTSLPTAVAIPSDDDASPSEHVFPPGQAATAGVKCVRGGEKWDALGIHVPTNPNDYNWRSIVRQAGDLASGTLRCG